MSFVMKALGPRAFRPDRSLNTAVFDAVAPALARRLAVKAEPHNDDVQLAYQALLQNERFVDGYIRSTADEENVKKRTEEAVNAFANI